MIGKTKLQLSHDSVGKAIEAYLNTHFNQDHQVRVEKWQPINIGTYGQQDATTDVQVEVLQDPEEPAALDLHTTRFTRDGGSNFNTTDAPDDGDNRGVGTVPSTRSR